VRRTRPPPRLPSRPPLQRSRCAQPARSAAACAVQRVFLVVEVSLRRCGVTLLRVCLLLRPQTELEARLSTADDTAAADREVRRGLCPPWPHSPSCHAARGPNRPVRLAWYSPTVSRVYLWPAARRQATESRLAALEEALQTSTAEAVAKLEGELAELSAHVDKVCGLVSQL
jgi:hypothetical protein